MAAKKTVTATKKGGVTLVESNTAFVRVGIGATINTGNFESMRLDVGITMPSDPADIENVFIKISEQAEAMLDKRIAELGLQK